MAIKKCDICTKSYEDYDGTGENAENANQIIFSNRNIRDEYYYVRQNTYDLCPDCMEKVIRFLDNMGKYSI